MELLLVRHARPEAVHPDGSGTVADPPLTDDGQAQAKTMAASLASGQYGVVTAVVSSTMTRAVQTADPLVAALGTVAETDERLAELDVGWTSYGISPDDYPTREAAFRALDGGRWGENTYDPAAFADRVRAGMDAVADRHPQGTVAVVCHGGVISAYVGHVLGTSRRLFFTPDYCSVTRILAEPSGYRELLSANEALHMRLP